MGVAASPPPSPTRASRSRQGRCARPAARFRGGLMEPVVGIFSSRSAATEAAGKLRGSGWAPERVQLLFPESSDAKVARVPVEDAEQPGVGKALGGVVGGAAGAAAGLGFGAVVASLFIPGVGAVSAIGLAAAALFGAGGAIGGAAAAGAL